MADDITKDAADLAARINALQAEQTECRKDADSLEETARQKRNRSVACKKEIEAAQTALANLNVRAAVESASAAAQRAQAAAEANQKAAAEELDRAKKLREEAESTLARLKAAEAKKE